MLEGYKALNKDLTNRYGMKFNVGEKYNVDGPLKYGSDGNGFHFCKHLSDVFRYYDNEDSIVAKVRGYGDYIEHDDKASGYFDLYVSREIEILKILSREEIVDIILESNYMDVIRFIQTYKMNNEEIQLFLREYYNTYSVVMNLIYYQIDKSIYHMVRNEDIDEIKKKYLK